MLEGVRSAFCGTGHQEGPCLAFGGMLKIYSGIATLRLSLCSLYGHGGV